MTPKITSVRDILDRHMSRGDALAVPCPKCGVAPNVPCIGARRTHNVRKSPHIERYDAAAKGNRS